MRGRWLADKFKVAMRSASAVILVGGSGPSLLRSSFGMPVCLLPMPHASSLLAAWVELLNTIPSISNITVVTGRDDDLPMIQETIDRLPRREGCSLRAMIDRNEHRGTAGNVADAVREDRTDNDVLVIEGASLAPDDIDAIMDKDIHDEAVDGIFLRTPTSEPAGLVLLKKRVLDLVPDVGFFDLKEQLVQKVVSSGGRILVRPISSSLRRITNPNDYINHVTEVNRKGRRNSKGGPWIHETAQVDPTAIITETTLIGRDVQIGQNAVIDQSIILDGAQIGSEALVARSIIRAKSQVPTRIRLVESVEIGGVARWNNRATGLKSLPLGNPEFTGRGRS